MTPQQYKERRLWWQAYKAALAGGSQFPEAAADRALVEYNRRFGQ